MKTLKLFSNKYIKSILLLMAGFLFGVIIFHHPGTTEKPEQLTVHQHFEDEAIIWTCAMHPQIRMDKPGQCPICGMDLIQLQSSNTEIDDAAIEMSESAIKLAEVQTSIVKRDNVSREVFLYGKIEADEKLIQSQAAHVPGRIEKLYVNVTGQAVIKGQLIAKIYSPELITAQKELLEAISMSEKYPALYEAAYEKLRNLKLTERQIRNIEDSANITTTFDIYADASGIISSRKANEGDYVNKGEILFDVINLSRVWAVFDAYESDLPWISSGQKVTFTTLALPGKSFEAKISFIDPSIDPEKRIARVRAEISNSGLLLKPELFINGIITSKRQDNGKQIIIPKSAVLWTGPRSIVYVKIPDSEQPAFKMREITLGASMKNSFIVLEGVNEGEEIVTNGTFSVDAAAQLAGKPSMMNHAESNISGMGKSVVSTQTITNNYLNKEDPILKISFPVSGNCEMCKDRIEKAATSVAGVTSAIWNIESKMISVSYEKSITNKNEIQKAIANSGHDTENWKADDIVYSALPECCLYRK